MQKTPMKVMPQANLYRIKHHIMVNEIKYDLHLVSTSRGSILGRPVCILAKHEGKYDESSNENI